MLDVIESGSEPPSIKRVLALTLDESGCVILRGRHWDGLYKLLPAAPDGSKPHLPLILAGEYMSDDAQKVARMREHIEWAERYGVVDRVHRYILGFLESVPKDKL
jgi:hypothetical protein